MPLVNTVTSSSSFFRAAFELVAYNLLSASTKKLCATLQFLCFPQAYYLSLCNKNISGFTHKINNKIDRLSPSKIPLKTVLHCDTKYLIALIKFSGNFAR